MVIWPARERARGLDAPEHAISQLIVHCGKEPQALAERDPTAKRATALPAERAQRRAPARGGHPQGFGGA